MTGSRNRGVLLKSAFGFALLFSLACAQAEECTPEGVEKNYAPTEMPVEFPEAMPMPTDYHLLTASSVPTDEYNPYPSAMIEFLASGSSDALFAFYEKALPAAGYRIVMWEKDEGGKGFRVKGEGIDQATIAVSDYDCRAYVMISVSLMP